MQKPYRLITGLFEDLKDSHSISGLSHNQKKLLQLQGKNIYISYTYIYI